MAKNQQIETLGLLIHVSYANLAMAHAAVSDGRETYSKIHYIIRARLLKGLRTGTMHIGSLVDDDREKMRRGSNCVYCGKTAPLTMDHLVPRTLEGLESGDNIVWACRSCNSSKGGEDLLLWYRRRDGFPPLLVLRRYLKLAAAFLEQHGLMDEPLVGHAAVPFAVEAIPVEFPPPSDLVLWGRGDGGQG